MPLLILLRYVQRVSSDCGRSLTWQWIIRRWMLDLIIKLKMVFSMSFKQVILKHLGFDIQSSTTPLTLTVNLWSIRWGSLCFLGAKSGEERLFCHFWNCSLLIIVLQLEESWRKTECLKCSGDHTVWPMEGMAMDIVKQLRKDMLFWILWWTCLEYKDEAESSIQTIHYSTGEYQALRVCLEHQHSFNMEDYFFSVLFFLICPYCSFILLLEPTVWLLKTDQN